MRCVTNVSPVFQTEPEGMAGRKDIKKSPGVFRPGIKAGFHITGLTPAV